MHVSSNRTGYHVPDVSPWPFCVSVGVLGLTNSFVIFCDMGGFNVFVGSCFFISLFVFVSCLVRWWCDVVCEATYLGMHSKLDVRNLRVGMMLFILSEVMFFVSFFWAFFNSSIGELSMKGVGSWPPVGIKAIYPWKVPVFNSVILLTSAMTITWCHKSLYAVNSTSDSDMGSIIDNSPYFIKLMKGWRPDGDCLISLGVTICLGWLFTFVQFNEYYMSSFTIADGVYGCTFYLLTGFHGLHVIAGTLFLMVGWARMFKGHFGYQNHYFGIDAAVWYWHFVDVVWIIVFSCVYVWGYAF